VTRTFVDSDVLIAGARSADDISHRAIGILDDPNRQFISSDFIRLEVLPKPIYFRRPEEVAFYEAYFTRVSAWVQPSSILVEFALQLGQRFGLNALDALNVAAATQASCDEFVTGERLTSPLLRVTTVTVVSLRASLPPAMS